MSGGGASPRSAPEARRRVVLLTGAPDSGKTTVCRRVAELASYKGLRVSGLVTEARRLSSGRIVQNVLNLRTGERRQLADYAGVDEGEPIGRGVAGRLSWTFIGESVRWGRHELDRCLTKDSDLLVIDQVGPLELVAGSGFANAVDVLRSARFGLAVVVVNPLVVERLRELLAGADLLELEVSPAGLEPLAERLVQLALVRRLTPVS
jgi:nucleoside-triphosphatase